jgi:cytoskeleton protein RodZ
MPLFSRSPKSVGENGLPTIPGEGEPETSPRNSIGELLRQTRQSYGGEIDRIAATLRIKAAYLTAIEEGQYDRLPGPVYAQGFVRAYAVHLGLDGDEAIRRFKQEIAGFGVSRDLSFPMPLGERSIPGGTMVLAALILAICGYGLWYYVSTGDRAHPERVSPVPSDLVAASQPPPPTVPPIVAAPGADAPAASPGVAADTAAAAPPAPSVPSTAAAQTSVASTTASSPPAAVAVAGSAPASTPAPQPPLQAPAPPAATATAIVAPATDPAATPAPGSTQTRVYGAPANVPARIIVHAIKDSWVQVSNGNQILTQRILHPGDIIRVPDQTGLSLRTGNGAGIALEVDGKLGKPLSGTVQTMTLNADQLSGHAPQTN